MWSDIVTIYFDGGHEKNCDVRFLARVSPSDIRSRDRYRVEFIEDFPEDGTNPLIDFIGLSACLEHRPEIVDKSLHPLTPEEEAAESEKFMAKLAKILSGEDE